MNLFTACSNGDKSLIESLISSGHNDWNEGLYGACSGGHVSVIDLMIVKGANDLKKGLWYALIFGQFIVAISLVQQRIEGDVRLFGICQECSNMNSKDSGNRLPLDDLVMLINKGITKFGYCQQLVDDYMSWKRRLKRKMMSVMIKDILSVTCEYV